MGSSILTNSGNIIQGTGQIGNNGLTLINAGTVNANLTGLGTGGESGHGGQCRFAGGIGRRSASAEQFVDQQCRGFDCGGWRGVAGAVRERGNYSGRDDWNGEWRRARSGFGQQHYAGWKHVWAADEFGTYSGSNNSTTVLAGTIVNNGTIQVNATGNNTFLRVNGAVTLQGTGTVSLSSNSEATAFINETVRQFDLDQRGNTIQGSGQIGSNGPGAGEPGDDRLRNCRDLTMALNPTTLTNQGLLEAEAGGLLQISNSVIANAGGTIEVNGVNSSVQFVNNVVIQGGTLSTINGGVLGSVSGENVTLDGTANAVAIGVSGTYTVGDNSTTNILGTINNLGTILLNSTGKSHVVERAGGGEREADRRRHRDDDGQRE